MNDKEGGVVRFFSMALILLACSLQGCSTVTGTVQGAADGFQKDVESVPSFWEKLKEADAKMQEYLW